MIRDYLRTSGPDALIELLCEMPVLYYEGDGSSMLLVTPRQS